MISQLEAFQIAEKAHEGQVDKAGVPYIAHVDRVARSLVAPHHQVLGLLHDVMEDSSWDEGDLFKAGVDPKTLITLKVLTHKKGQPYNEYINGILENFDAAIVKLADLRDNMDITRLPDGLKDKDLKRLAKYHKAYHRLIKAVGKFIDEDEELARGPK